MGTGVGGVIMVSCWVGGRLSPSLGLPLLGLPLGVCLWPGLEGSCSLLGWLSSFLFLVAVGLLTFSFCVSDQGLGATGCPLGVSGHRA